MSCKNCDKRLFLYEKNYCSCCKDGSKSVIKLYNNIYVTMIKISSKKYRKILIVNKKIEEIHIEPYRNSNTIVIIADTASELRNHFETINSYINMDSSPIILETNNLELSFILTIAYMIENLKVKPEFAIDLCKKNYSYFQIADKNIDILQGYYWTKCLKKFFTS